MGLPAVFRVAETGKGEFAVCDEDHAACCRRDRHRPGEEEEEEEEEKDARDARVGYQCSRCPSQIMAWTAMPC
jgi:hypothetical protein